VYSQYIRKNKALDLVYLTFYFVSRYAYSSLDVFLIGVFFLILFGIGQISNFLSTILYRRLVKVGNPNAYGIRIATLIGIFLAIFLTLAYLFLINLRFQR
jgi:hypothetical protein